jgi:hypothetical protein
MKLMKALKDASWASGVFMGSGLGCGRRGALGASGFTGSRYDDGLVFTMKLMKAMTNASWASGVFMVPVWVWVAAAAAW